MNSAKKALVDLKRNPLITETALRGNDEDDETSGSPFELTTDETPETVFAAQEIAQVVNAAMEALIAIAKVRIWSAHRNNAISASVPLNPGIDLTQTIRVTAPTVDAQGKCRSLTHRMSTETGVAVTDFSLAICSIAGTGITHPDTATAA